MTRVDGMGPKVPTAVKAAGIAAGAVAIGSVVYAAKQGKVADVFKKAVDGAEQVKFTQKLGDAAKALGDGYKKAGAQVLEKGKQALDFVKSHLPKIGKGAKDVVEDVIE